MQDADATTSGIETDTYGTVVGGASQGAKLPFAFSSYVEISEARRRNSQRDDHIDVRSSRVSHIGSKP